MNVLNFDRWGGSVSLIMFIKGVSEKVLFFHSPLHSHIHYAKMELFQSKIYIGENNLFNYRDTCRHMILDILGVYVRCAPFSLINE